MTKEQLDKIGNGFGINRPVQLCTQCRHEAEVCDDIFRSFLRDVLTNIDNLGSKDYWDKKGSILCFNCAEYGPDAMDMVLALEDA